MSEADHNLSCGRAQSCNPRQADPGIQGARRRGGGRTHWACSTLLHLLQRRLLALASQPNAARGASVFSVRPCVRLLPSALRTRALKSFEQCGRPACLLCAALVFWRPVSSAQNVSPPLVLGKFSVLEGGAEISQHGQGGPSLAE